jgi:hypothetical protein
MTHRHMKANNKYLGDVYDNRLPSWFISYLDANNLYGWAMSQAFLMAILSGVMLGTSYRKHYEYD